MALFKGFPNPFWRNSYPGTKVLKEKPAVQSYPYKSDAVGFNTRFSRYELECKERWGKPLTRDEEQFLCYVRAIDRHEELGE